MNLIRDELTVIAKERYCFEMERKEQISSFLSLPLGIITILSGLFLNFGNFIKSCGIHNIPFIFYIFLILFLIMWLFSIISLIPCLFQKYTYLLTPDGWLQYKNDLIEYYHKNNETDVDNKIIDDLKDNILKQYIDYAEANAASNDKKAYYLTRSKTFIIFTAFLGIICVSIQYSRNYTLPEPIPKVIISNLSTLKEAIMAEKPQKPILPPNVKPIPKPGVTINEGIKPKPRPGRIINSQSNDRIIEATE